MSLGLLFSGQGTQHAGMLAWLDDEPAAASTLAEMTRMLDVDWRRRLGDTDWATRNDVAQVLVTGLGIAAWQVLRPWLPEPAVIAGYSVGELAAFSAAGVFDGRAALALAAVRAEAMQRSGAGTATGLIAIIGATPATIDAMCRDHGMVVAIRQAPDRVLLGGTLTALDAAQDACVAAGLHATRLPIGVASHTPWMRAAAQEFEPHLATIAFAAPGVRLICNHDARERRDADGLRHALAAQINALVRWDRCLEAVEECGVRCVLEMGPGSALARLWNETRPRVPARSIDEFRSAGAIARWVQTRLSH